MQGGTEALAAPAAEAVKPAEIEAVPYDEVDVAVIRALQGDMPIVATPYAAAAEAVGMPEEKFLEHLEGMQERGILRRVAAILYHRRAGFTPTGWASGRCLKTGSSRSAAAWRPSAGSPTATRGPPTQDWPYALFTMAHGRSKEECDAILDAIAERHRHP